MRVEGSSLTRRQLAALDRRLREARARDDLRQSANPDHLIDGNVWESKVLRSELDSGRTRTRHLGTFEPETLYRDVVNNTHQARRFIINADNVAGSGQQLVAQFHAWRSRNATRAELRHGLFPRTVREVVIVRDGMVYPLYRASPRWAPPRNTPSQSSR